MSKSNITHCAKCEKYELTTGERSEAGNCKTCKSPLDVVGWQESV